MSEKTQRRVIAIIFILAICAQIAYMVELSGWLGFLLLPALYCAIKAYRVEP